MTTALTSGAERRLAVEHWLLAAAPDHKRVRAEWLERPFAMLPCGGLFAAVRIPASVVQAAAGSTEEKDVDQYLAEALVDGPVICDRYAARYYALVPTSAVRRWDVPDTVCLGAGWELGVPRPGVADLRGASNAAHEAAMRHCADCGVSGEVAELTVKFFPRMSGPGGPAIPLCNTCTRLRAAETERQIEEWAQRRMEGS